MRQTAKMTMLALISGIFIVSVVGFGPAQAGVRVGFSYTSGPADIRVWLDRSHYDDAYYDDYDDDYYESSYEYDVYPSEDEVVLYVRASRGCYATVYVVDTAGYIHVLHPLSPYDNAFLRGGRVYRFYLSDYGFHNRFGRGVAYAYAVSSPLPFTYTHYDIGIFGNGFGFRIYGDPYVGARHFYLSLLAGSCDRRLIGVGHARFYLREYVRYPNYLCAGWHDYYGVRQYCRGNCSVYRHYSVHAKNPYRVLRPTHRLRHKVGKYTEIVRASDRRRVDVRERLGHEPKKLKSKSSEARRFTKKSMRRDEVRKGNEIRKDYADRSLKKRAVERKATMSRRSKVVRSSRDSFVRGQKNISAMRQQLKERSAQKRSSQMDGDRKRATRTSRATMAKRSDKKRDFGVKKDSPRKRSSNVQKTSRAGKSRTAKSGSSKKAGHGKKR